MKPMMFLHATPMLPCSKRGRTRLVAWMARRAGATKLLEVFLVCLN